MPDPIRYGLDNPHPLSQTGEIRAGRLSLYESPTQVQLKIGFFQAKIELLITDRAIS